VTVSFLLTAPATGGTAHGAAGCEQGVGRTTMVRRSLGLVALLAPVGLYYWFVLRYGVNVPFQDTWNGTLPVLHEYVQGHLTLAALWQPHNENRMLVPNLILVLLDSLTRMNQLVDMLISATMLVAACGVICWLAVHVHRMSLIWLVPCPAVMLAVLQTENALWAFQLAWSLIVLLTAVTLTLLEIGRDRWLFLLLACATAGLASFSSLQGLLIWPVGLAYGLASGWRFRPAGVWVAFGIACLAVYWYHFGPVHPASDPLAMLSQPVTSIRFMLILIGAPFVYHRLAMGIVVVCIAGATAFLALRTHSWRRCRVGFALIATSLLFDVLVTAGRGNLGLAQATASRYSTYNLMLLVGIYLVAVAASGPLRRLTDGDQVRDERPWGWGLVAICACAMAWQFSMSLPYGLEQGEGFSARLSQGAALLRDYRTSSASALASDLFSSEGAYIEHWAPTLEGYHWAPFS